MLYMYSGVLLKNTRIPIFEILYVYDIYINIYLTLMSRIILSNSIFYTSYFINWTVTLILIYNF